MMSLVPYRSPVPRLPMRMLAAALLLAALAGVATAQDINGYTIQSSKDLFTRELDRFTQSGDLVRDLPGLDCAIEYLRRNDDKEIVYRRGPIPLQQSGSAGLLHAGLPVSQPASEADEPAPPHFIGGLIIDLPRAGEVSDRASEAAGDLRYMVRAAVVPIRYNDRTLTAKIVLERAVVHVSGTVVEVLKSEVFSKQVELDGNEPLNFALPAWDRDEKGRDAVTEKTGESVLITLETPRFYGFSRNMPEPFSRATLVTYAVPRRSLVTLSVTIEGRQVVLDSGQRHAGRYSLDWNAVGLPDGRYPVTLRASETNSPPVDVATIVLTKDHLAGSYEVPTTMARFAALEDSRFAFSTESGIAYQVPGDEARALRNMFTHLTVRLGYRLTTRFELGVAVGQEAFQEHPGPRVDVARISNYGGVVGYTYGFIGGYLRWALSDRRIQPLVQSTVAFTSAATMLDLGLGLRTTLFSHTDVYLLPSATFHLRSTTSMKFGLQYGFTVRF